MKGILMKDFLVDLIPEESKTHTRRIINLPKSAHASCTIKDMELQKGTYAEWTPHVPHKNGCMIEIKPRYKKGEVLYIKENHLRSSHENGDAIIIHLDDLVNSFYWNESLKKVTKYLTHSQYKSLEGFKEVGYGKRGKMIMPEWAARHYVKIIDVRVERLQDISNEDCIKEGIRKTDYLSYQSPHKTTYDYATVKWAFEALINHVDGKETWDSNPYVFVYEFEYMCRAEVKFKENHLDAECRSEDGHYFIYAPSESNGYISIGDTEAEAWENALESMKNA